MTAFVTPTPWRTPDRLKDPAQALWIELRFAPEPIDEFDLIVAAVNRCEDALPTRGATIKLLEQLLGRWVDAQLVSTDPGKPHLYQIKRKCRSMASPPAIPAPPHTPPLPKNSLRQRIWSAARVLRNFDLTTLVIAAEAKPSSALQILGVLERGGWLRRTEAGWSTAATRRWGPVAPRWFTVNVRQGRFIRVTDSRDGSVIDLPVRRQRNPHHRKHSSQAASSGGVS